MNQLAEELKKMRSVLHQVGELPNHKITCKNCRHSWAPDFAAGDTHLCHYCGMDNQTGTFDEGKTLSYWNKKLGSAKVLDEFSTPMPENFDVTYFKTLRSFNKRVQYCNQQLQRLGSGSSRIVYKITDDIVLKLAKNPKGLEQNMLEADWYIQDQYGDIVTKLIESDQESDDTTWVIMEMAKKMSPKRFLQITGFTLEKLRILMTIEDHRPRSNQMADMMRRQITQGEIEAIYDNPTGYEALGLQKEYDMLINDLTAPSAWGEVNRNGKSLAVLRDFGITNDMYNRLYAKEKGRW